MSRLLRAAGALVSLGSLAVIAAYLRHAWPGVRGLRIDPAPAAIALGCFATGLLINATMWHRTLGRLGSRLGWPRTLRIWFVSQLWRYMPGNVLTFLGRAYLSGREGVAPQAIAVSMAFEVLQTVTAALIVTAGTMPFWDRRTVVVEFVLLGSPLLACYAWPTLLEGAIGWLLRRTGQPTADLGDSRGYLLALLPGYCAGWIANGAGIYFLACALAPLPAGKAPVLAGIFALAWTVGFLSVITPSGLGIRDGVLIYLLGLHLPAPVAIALAALSRVWLILAEVGCVLLILGGTRFKWRSGTALEGDRD